MSELNEYSSSCACKGVRTCLICENTRGISVEAPIRKENGTYVYCPWCNKAWPGWDINDFKQHPNHSGEPIEFPGVYIQLDFLTDAEEKSLMYGIDNIPWDMSQSGRRKQNYGPKCNFKKNKLRHGTFSGFPAFSQFVQEKFKTIDILKDFQTIEQCSLEYCPERGAAIDAHIDDCWIWGERIITVNLLSDSILTMTKYNGDDKRYNLHMVKTYPAVLSSDGSLNETEDSYKIENCVNYELPVIRIPMPKKSLLIMYGAARYDWEHRIIRNDIIERRVCLAYREFTPPYLKNGDKSQLGDSILKSAVNFF